MIELAPLRKTEEIKEFYEKNGVCYNKNSGVVTANQKGEILGFCLYDLTDEKMVIKKIEPICDIPLADGILRSTLHIAAERSIMNTFYEGEDIETLCEKLQFIKDKQQKSLEIDKLFQSCCNCQ